MTLGPDSSNVYTLGLNFGTCSKKRQLWLTNHCYDNSILTAFLKETCKRAMFQKLKRQYQINSNICTSQKEDSLKDRE
jgi:hypothetical protein